MSKLNWGKTRRFPRHSRRKDEPVLDKRPAAWYGLNLARRDARMGKPRPLKGTKR